MIDQYSFGKIIINGKAFTKDIIIQNGQIKSWWRKQGHNVQLDDVKEVIKEKPDIMIIGTGGHGAMQVPEETRRFILEKGIKLITEKTSDAVNTFNKEKQENKAGLFHLTC